MLKMEELGTARQMPKNPKFRWQTPPEAKGHPRRLALDPGFEAYIANYF